MKKYIRKTVVLLLAVTLFTAGSGFSMRKAAQLPSAGGEIAGFGVEKTERLAQLGATITYLTHRQTGAQVVYAENTGAAPALLLVCRTADGLRRTWFTAETEDELLRFVREGPGTIFSGAADAETAPVAYRAFLGVLLPGSDAAGDGVSGEITAANTLAVVCAPSGKAEALLSALNDALSSVPAGEVLAADAAYRRIDRPAVKTAALPVSAGESGVYFGIVCPRAGDWTRTRLEALTAALSQSGSALEKRVRGVFPGTAVRCGTERAGADAAVWFFAQGLRETEAETFRDTVLAVLRDTGNGLDAASLEKLSAAQRLEELTFADSPQLGETLCAAFSEAWLHTGTSGFAAKLDTRWNAAAYFSDGSCAEMLREELLPSERTALVTVVPEAAEPEETGEAEAEPADTEPADAEETPEAAAEE